MSSQSRYQSYQLSAESDAKRALKSELVGERGESRGQHPVLLNARAFIRSAAVPSQPPGAGIQFDSHFASLKFADYRKRLLCGHNPNPNPNRSRNPAQNDKQLV